VDRWRWMLSVSSFQSKVRRLIWAQISHQRTLRLCGWQSTSPHPTQLWSTDLAITTHDSLVKARSRSLHHRAYSNSQIHSWQATKITPDTKIFSWVSIPMSLVNNSIYYFHITTKQSVNQSTQWSIKKRATLFLTITPMFHGRFLHLL